MTTDNFAAHRKPCPPWCVADHFAEDEPGQRRHRSRARTVAATQAPTKRGGVRVGEFVVEVFRDDPAPTVWVYVGDGVDQYLELSLESTRRLVVGVTRSIRGIRG